MNIISIFQEKEKRHFMSSVNLLLFNCLFSFRTKAPLQWRHNGRDGVSNHQPQHCLLNCLFRRKSKATSKLRVTGLCARNSPLTGEFPAQMASNAENVSIWWRHHARNALHYCPRRCPTGGYQVGGSRRSTYATKTRCATWFSIAVRRSTYKANGIPHVTKLC